MKEPNWYYWWWDPNGPKTVEIVPRGGDVDVAQPVASFEVPEGAELFQVGDEMVSVKSVPNGWPNYETTVQVFDLSDPTNPTQVGSLVTTELPAAGNLYFGDIYGPAVRVVGDSLVFTSIESVWGEPFHVNTCWKYVSTTADCLGEEGCTYDVGERTCYEIDGKAPYCVGGFASCTDHEDAESSCAPYPGDPSSNTSSYCYDTSHGRVRTRYSFEALDLSDPTNPKIGGVLQTPVEDHAVRLLDDDGSLYVTLKRPVELPLDPRPYAQ
ncbi:hypothetical protein [Polyangium spumosum]|uniref:Uncharacterized protein n=1 Tax=Polyangium spumosum TaxID=889282 RepID=A0A6N7PYF5_9BACT|nr:hypothetical protein [Polyangium spumosum]MRG97232.1 hypothetical protein [Polyangium spumosum]